MQDAATQRFNRRRRLAVVAAVAVFILLVLVVLPFGMSYGLHKWLLANGGDDVTIGDIDFNAFTGRAAISNLQLSADQRTLLTIPRLELDVDWLPLLSRRLVVRSVVVNGVAVEVRMDTDGSMRIGGIRLPDSEPDPVMEPEKTWHVGVDQVAVANTTINYRSDDLQLDTRLDDLRLSGIKTWASEPASLVLSGAINDAAISLDGQLPPLANGTGYSGRVVVDGLELSSFAGLVRDAVSELAGRLSIDSHVNILQSADKHLAFRLSGSVSAAGLSVTQAENQLAFDSLEWTGDVAMPAGDEIRVSANGQVVSIGAAYGVVGETSILKVGSLELDTVQLSEGNIALGTLAASDLVADLQRDRDGEWRVAQAIDSLPETEKITADAETGAPADGDPTGNISIDAITISGDSSITLHDASVDPAFDTRLTLTAADIGRIDSASPAQDTPVTIKARTGKHSRIVINGTVQPFAERPTLNLESSLEGIALTALSPYTMYTLGYALKSGHLDADSSIRIDRGKLDIGNKLTIRGLEVTPVDNASRERLDTQMSVPLDTALNMLRDKHDTIRLKLPVTGDINSPDFNVSDAVNTAVGKALKKGSMTYLTLALQPYAALISIVKIAGEVATRVRLEPVVFDAGAGTRRVGSGEYLGKVAGIMEDRPELNVKICGFASEQDRLALGGQSPVDPPIRAAGRLPDTVLKPETDKPAAGTTPPPAVAVTDEQLLELASQRADALTDYLVSEHAIKASRLVACQPAIDSETDAQGRVDLLI